MSKRISIVFLTLIFFTFLSVSTALAKNDKPKHKKNTPHKSETALQQQNKNSQKPEKPEKAEKEKGQKGGPSGQNGRSFMGKLYFFELDPDPEDLIVEEPVEEEPLGDEQGGEPVEDPEAEDFIDEENDVLDIAWGKMNYNLVGPYLKFVFNGHGLEPYTEYTLIYYPEPSGGEGLILLGSGESDEFGDVHMNERLYGICDIPAPDDVNFPIGGQLILVLTADICADVDCVTPVTPLPDPYPESYLFGFNLMTFDDTMCEYADPSFEEDPEVPEEVPAEE